MSVATVLKMSLTNKSAPKGYPEKVSVENHTVSPDDPSKSIALFTIFQGVLVIGFARKGQFSMKAFGLSDIVSIGALRNFMLNLQWEGKYKDALVTKQSLELIHAKTGGDLQKMLDELKLL